MIEAAIVSALLYLGATYEVHQEKSFAMGASQVGFFLCTAGFLVAHLVQL